MEHCLKYLPISYIYHELLFFAYGLINSYISDLMGSVKSYVYAV